MNRRRFLSTIGLVLATSTTGCTALDRYGGSQETATAQTRFWLEDTFRTGRSLIQDVPT